MISVIQKEKGPEITSKDIKFTIEHLATKTDDNYQFNTILKDRLVGVNDFFEKKAPQFLV